MTKWIALGALLFPFSLAGCGHRTVVVYNVPPPPAGVADAGHQGYNDGVVAAQQYISAGRPLKIDWHSRFRNPPVPPPLFGDYRHGFRAGYNQVVHHGPPQGYPGL